MLIVFIDLLILNTMVVIKYKFNFRSILYYMFENNENVLQLNKTDACCIDTYY